MRQVPVSLSVPFAVPNCRFRHGRRRLLCILIDRIIMGSSLHVNSSVSFIVILCPIKDIFCPADTHTTYQETINAYRQICQNSRIFRCIITLFFDLEARTYIVREYRKTCLYENKKFWEELNACFPWYDMDRTGSNAPNNSSIVAAVVIAAVRFFPSRCLATIRDAHVGTHMLLGGIYEVPHWDGFTCHDRPTKFHKDWFRHSQVDKGPTQSAWRSRKFTFIFLNIEIGLKENARSSMSGRWGCNMNFHLFLTYIFVSGNCNWTFSVRRFEFQSCYCHMCSENVGASTSHYPISLHGLLQW